MPINLFSKIKIRRGLSTDLPDLNESELGFATDTGQVFIGAPDYPPLEDKGRSEPDEEFPYKNIELLTNVPNTTINLQYDYTGNTGVTIQTGPTASQPVVRNLQNRLNDYVTAAGFGVIPDGSDISVEFNRMLQEIYNYNSEQDRKIIYIPAGKYIFTSETIELPPYTYLQGEGKNSTTLSYTGSGSRFIETIDSLFQSDAAIGTNSADLPQYITIKDLTIEVNSLIDIILFNRCSNINFENVRVVGAWVNSATSVDAITFDKIGSAIELNNFVFTNCDFINTGNILIEQNVGSHVENVLFDNCLFNGCYNGFIFDESDTNNVKITNSVFKNNENRILRCNRGNNFKSITNNYVDDNTLNNEAILIETAFVNFTSMSDNFVNVGDTIVNGSNTSIIKSHDEDNHIFNDVEYSKQFNVTLADNATNDNLGVQFELDRYSAVFFDYTLLRDGDMRIGRIKIMNDGTNIYTSTEFSESAATGVTFDGEVVNIGGTNFMRPIYTTTSTGQTADMNFTYVAWSK